MRVVLAVISAALLSAAFTSGCGSVFGDGCGDVKPGGACSADSDCVLASCASRCCGGFGHCGEGAAFAKADLAGLDCMVVEGQAAPSSCDPHFGCACPACAAAPGVAKCVSGTCQRVSQQP